MGAEVCTEVHTRARGTWISRAGYLWLDSERRDPHRVEGWAEPSHPGPAKDFGVGDRGCEIAKLSSRRLAHQRK